MIMYKAPKGEEMSLIIMIIIEEIPPLPLIYP